MNGHLVTSCIGNACTKNYQKLVISLQVTIKNVGDVFLCFLFLSTPISCVPFISGSKKHTLGEVAVKVSSFAVNRALGF